MLWIDPPRGGSRPSLALGKAAFRWGVAPRFARGATLLSAETVVA